MGGFGFKFDAFGTKFQGTVLDPGAIGGLTVRVPHDNGVLGKVMNDLDTVNKVPGTLATAIGDAVKAPGAIKDAADAGKEAAGSGKEAADAARMLIEKLMATLANAEHQAHELTMALKAVMSSLAFNVIVALVITALVLLVLLLGAKLYRTLRPVSV